MQERSLGKIAAESPLTTGREEEDRGTSFSGASGRFLRCTLGDLVDGPLPLRIRDAESASDGQDKTLPTSTFTADAENPQDSRSQSAGSCLRTIALRPRTGSVARRTRRLGPCLYSKWMGRSLRSRTQSIAMWASSRLFTPPIRGRPRYATRPWRTVEDITNKIAATLFLPEEQKKAQRKALVDCAIPFYLTRLQQRLEAHAGRYFAADHLSVADLKIFVWIRHLRSGALDRVRLTCPIASRPS
jgi:Glutathione S-transferase, C-terminal domain